MELHCLPTETPSSASSCSTDPLYDNCPPFSQRERHRQSGTEGRSAWPLAARLPGPGSPPPGSVPALAEGPMLAVGGRAPGHWPECGYCSWRGGRAWEPDLDPGRKEGPQGHEDGALSSRGSSPSECREHQSVMSLYDNLTAAGTTRSLQEACGVETSSEEHLEGHSFTGLMLGDPARKETHLWSPPDKKDPRGDRKQEPELDSGSCDPPVSPAGSTAAEVQEPPFSSRIPPPVPLADPSASALRSLLTGFQQQIVRQREEYEARIVSLEQRNEELQVEVLQLKTNLVQQRHWYQAVQAKILESEQARAAAELRNATLQREMEQFFDTFGELNNEAKKTEHIVRSF